MFRPLRAIGRLACAAVALVSTVPASADPAVFHPDLSEAVAAARRAKGPEVYAALREVWRTWDRADPAQVEAAIVALSSEGALDPAARAYADLLGAYARRRRGDLDGALARVKALGFVGRWATIGPFDNENKGGFAQELAVEHELGEPITVGRSYDGKERQVKWRLPPETTSWGWLDFGELVRPREEVCGVATTFVRARAGTPKRDATLWIGTAGAFRLYWDTQKVLEDAGYRSLDADRFAVTVPLGPDWHRITVKVCGSKESPKLVLRIGDARGAPDPNVEIATDPIATSASIPKAANDGRVKKKPTLPAQRVLGPVQAFERAVSAARPPIATLEAYARYLWVTGGDPEGEHRARDLARRVADAEPSISRLLFAGELAEDNNQRRVWVERAAAMARDEKDARVILAQAELTRSGTSFRDAIPLYEKVLEIDPDNVTALLGRVDVYVEAGLPRTALSTLERAVARMPKSVALLRALAGRLRAVGRDTEASEVEARYAALRFDDSGWLAEQIELATARRDRAGAERWIERLLRSEPDSAWARSVAARAYRSLGETERALATYQRTLEIAPEDVETLRAMSDLYGEEGRRDEQLRLLRQILTLYPQAKEVREYVEHIQPPRPRADEAYAWTPDRFLPGARGPAPDAQRHGRRTLRNLTVTTVFPNGLASRFRQVVFQPLTDEAAAAARQYAFSYAADRQVVQLRASRVYRADGKIDEAIESGETGANDPSISMYTSQRTFYVLFPRLNAGDVVELRYRVEDVAPRNEIADHFGEIELLQSDEPIASSEYVLIGPRNRKFYSSVSKLPNLKHEVREEGDTRIERWSATDVPAVPVEPYMPPWSEVLGQVHVSTFESWDAVGKWYWGLAREQLDVDDEVRKKVREITKGLTDDRAKVRAVYEYATELRYVALELGIEGIKPRRCALTLARGWGDCKDKATVIVTMLRELGIPANLVLVRTRQRGDIGEAPASLAPFDHAIAYVPSLDLYLDGTAEHTGTRELPAMDRGAFALEIQEGKARLVRLPQPPPEESMVQRKVELSIAQDGPSELKLEVQRSGVFAAEWRSRYLGEDTRRERAARDLAADFGPVELAPGKGAIDVGAIEDVEQPVRVKVKAKSSSLVRREGSAWSVPVGPAMRLSSELASLSSRTLDLVLPALTSREEEWTIKLPPGTKVLREPSPVSVDGPLGSVNVSFESTAGKLVVKSSLTFKKVRIAPAEYGAWRTFCETVDRAFGQRVLIGK